MSTRSKKSITKNMFIDHEMLSQISSGFNNDISGCLSFLDLIAAQCRNRSSKSEVLAVLKSSQTAESFNKGYYDVMKCIFNKSPNSAIFKSGEQ